MARNTPVVPSRLEDCPRWLYEILRGRERSDKQVAAAIAAITRGEAPSSGGAPIAPVDDYLFKPGLPGGQTAYGGTGASDALTLISTAHATKGKIFLGFAKASAYDESTQRLGLGAISPVGILDITQTNTGASDTYRPSSNGDSLGAWVNNNGNTTNMWSYVDEEVPNDSDFLRDAGTPTGGARLVKWATIPTPLSTDIVILRWRVGWFGSNPGTGGCNFTISINDGVAEYTSPVVDLTDTPNAYTTYAHQLTSAEITAINWANVHIGVSEGGGGVGYSGNGRLSWVEISVADGINPTNLTNWYESSGLLVDSINSVGTLTLGNAFFGNHVRLVLQATSGQTANLLQLKNSAGTAVALFDKDAKLTIPGLTLTGAADYGKQLTTNFRVENASGADPGSPAVGQIWLRTDL